MYVKRNNVARSHDDLYHRNTALLSFTHARPCQQHNTYLTICVLYIVALCTSPPVTGSTLNASCKFPDIVVRFNKL